jgi:hypothetical protein
LQFTHVPVYVLDYGAGVNGILGMNLFNNAHEMLFNPYDPSGPSVTLTFNAAQEMSDALSPDQINELNAMGVPFMGSMDGQDIPGLSSPGSNSTTAGLLTVAANEIQANEGTNFSGMIGSITDTLSTAQIQQAMINWGDGQSSQAILSGNGLGSFAVAGSHVYAEEGTYLVTITAKDSNGHVASDSTAAKVGDAYLSVYTAPVSASEGHAFSGVLASFNDANSMAEIGDFQAEIDWGDGQTSTGDITSVGGTAFNISANHIYSEEGSYAFKVTVTDTGGSSGSASETINVADGFLTATIVQLGTQVEGTSYSGLLGHFGDSDAFGTLSDYTATIYWGDGTSSAGNIVGSQSGGFDVSGSHVYTTAGIYNYGITIQDSGGASGSAGNSVQVIDAPLLGSGQSFTASPTGSTGSVLVATFTDGGGLAAPSSYSATIDWGDASTSAGTITQPGGTGTPFNVTGNHVYSTRGSWTVHTTITDASGSSVVVVSQVHTIPTDAILGRSGKTGQIWVGLSDGSSAFTSGLWATWSSKVSWQDVFTADFNGDGKADVVGRDPNTGCWWVGSSNGSAFTSSRWGAWSPKVTWVDVHVADLNGNGKADLIGRVLQTGQWWAAVSTGSSFTNQLWATWSTSVSWVDVQVGDFNGDGLADIAGRVQSSGEWWVGQSTGSNLATGLWGAWNPNVTWVDVRTGNFAGDGKADIVGRVQQDGSWWLAQSSGSGFTNSYWGQWNPNVTWVDVLTGDFIGDGKTDLIGRVQQDGSWWLAQSTGSGFTNSFWAQWNPNVTWVDVQVGDFSGGGKSDLTGRSLGTGQWWTSLSGGSTSSSTSMWAVWSTTVTWSDVRSADVG